MWLTLPYFFKQLKKGKIFEINIFISNFTGKALNILLEEHWPTFYLEDKNVADKVIY